jgi:hypothetical protein
MYTVVYFLFKKANKPLKDKGKYTRCIGPIIILSFAANIMVLIYVIVKIGKISKECAKDPDGNKCADQASDISCTSIIWVVSSLFDMVSVIIFLIFLTQLDEIVNT